MIEILAGDGIENAFAALGITAKNTYKRVMPPDDGHFHVDAYEVWELSDDDHERLCDIAEDDWKDDWGWWRSCEGSNLGLVQRRYNIKNHYIEAWDGYSRTHKNKAPNGLDEWFPPRKYPDLLEYFSEEIGVSTEKNVCALAVDLAGQNGMTMGELFTKFLR